MSTDLSTTTLTDAQADGLACVHCGRDYLIHRAVAHVPVERDGEFVRGPSGSQLFVCANTCEYDVQGTRAASTPGVHTVDTLARDHLADADKMIDDEAIRDEEFQKGYVYALDVVRNDAIRHLENERPEGLSQKEIGDTLGVSHQSVGRDLRNVQTDNDDEAHPPTRTDSLGRERPTTYAPRVQGFPPTIDELARVADWLDISTADLIHWREVGPGLLPDNFAGRFDTLYNWVDGLAIDVAAVMRHLGVRRPGGGQ